ncbi:MAG: acyl-CoA dehydrogenase family protein, partial [Actinomycetota bacterium]
MSPPPPLDFLDLDRLLSDEERLIRDTTRSFVADRVLPEVAGWFERGELPRELAKELGDLGLLGMHLQGYGCAGTNAVSYGLACLELEAGDSGARSFVSVQGSLAMYPIWRYGSEEQKQRWLPPMAAGEVVGCFGLTEPDFGSNPAGMRTSARRDGDDWVLNGTKMWITNGPDADTLVVYAKTEPQLGARGVTAFLIEKGMKGFSIAQKLDKLGMRGSHTGELVFQDVEVPAENVLGNLNGGAKVLMSGLDYERAVLAAGPIGIMQAVMDNVVPYIHDRKQFGQSIGEFQLIQGKVADMYTVLQAARAFCYTVGKNLDKLGA